ncbi:MAG: FliA/WhiG family RNA polymerase sigma factor [Candidatus Kapabacteria bacterium]|nr:FliA/WhiG family RNA polymerase sigma factor [Candidatus Kapabacteria bacterium]
MALSEEEISKTWLTYVAEPTLALKQKLIMNYIWLVKYVQKQMNLPPNTILTFEDFTNIGILGLYEAIDRFEPNRGVRFESFAISRVRGMIQDELRRLDWLSRSTRKKAQAFATITNELQASGDISQDKIIQKLGVTPERYESYLAAAAAAKASISLSDIQTVQFENEEYDIFETLTDDTEVDSLSNLVEKEKVVLIQEYIKKLEDKQSIIMSLYYYEELTFKEIGAVLNVSESRVCQIHSQVLNKLKMKFKEYEHA